ncbi:MAG TPA: glycosyltransferase, partial [bacterium]|nr:glycosyltransferase [bacterium]
ATLRPALSALESQLQYMDSEIVLVGDPESAQQESLPDRPQENSVPVRCVETRQSASLASAWNQGVENAAGEYLLLMQPRIQLHPESLGMMVEYLRGDRKIGVITPQIQTTDTAILPQCQRFPTHKDVMVSSLGLPRMFPVSRWFNGWQMGDFSHRDIREVEGAALLLWLTSQVVWNKVGPFDENFPYHFYDLDWCRRLRSAGYTTLFYPQAKAYRLRDPLPAAVLQRRISLFRLLDKHYDRVHQQVANFVTGVILYGTLPFHLAANVFRRRTIENNE